MHSVKKGIGPKIPCPASQEAKMSDAQTNARRVGERRRWGRRGDSAQGRRREARRRKRRARRQARRPTARLWREAQEVGAWSRRGGGSDRRERHWQAAEWVAGSGRTKDSARDQCPPLPPGPPCEDRGEMRPMRAGDSAWTATVDGEGRRRPGRRARRSRTAARAEWRAGVASRWIARGVRAARHNGGYSSGKFGAPAEDECIGTLSERE